MADFYQDINPSFLKDAGKGDKDKAARELAQITKVAGEKEEQVKPKTKTDREWDASVVANWKLINKFYIAEIPVPPHLCSLPPGDIAVRGVYADLVEEEMAPGMWVKGPGFPAKSGIICIFKVLAISTIGSS